MGMPLTVGELAEFLNGVCARSQEAEDALDWSLAQWRRLKMAADKGCDENTGESASRITEEQTRFTGTVLVHQVPSAPPRPILCTDDPDANLLKAVELLLAYPYLDAVPVVSQSRCTVVAHLTLSYCLSYMLQRLRGTAIK